MQLPDPHLLLSQACFNPFDSPQGTTNPGFDPGNQFEQAGAGTAVGLAGLEKAVDGKALLLPAEEGGCDLIASGQLPLDVAEVGTGVLPGLAPNLLAGEVNVDDDHSGAVWTCYGSHLLLKQRGLDLSECVGKLLNVLLRQLAEGRTDGGKVSKAFLPPGLSYGRIGNQRLRIEVEILHVATVAENGNQRLDHLVNRRVGVGLLLDAQVPIQDLNQVEPLSYPAKSDEKTMSGGGLDGLRSDVGCRTMRLHQSTLHMVDWERPHSHHVSLVLTDAFSMGFHCTKSGLFTRNLS